jgi:hypothetical protein
MSEQKTGKNREKTADVSGKRTNLDRQYRDIGISAVAAALPYVGEAKTRKESDRRSNARKRSVLAV